MKKTLFFLLILCLYFSVNYFIFSFLYKELIVQQSLGIKTIFIIGSSLLSIAFVLFYLLHKVLPVPIASFLYKIGTGWLIIIIYPFIITLIATALVRYSIFSNSCITALGIIIITLLLCVYGYYNYHKKRKIQLNITISKSFNSLKIIVISDLHLGYAIQRKELRSWIEKINSEKPDIVLIAGDIIDNSIRPLYYYKLYEYFSKIETRLGIYACLGNHEYLSGVEKSIEFIKKAGIHIVRDSVTLIDNQFYLIGRDDRTNTKRKELSLLMKGIDENKPVIVLDHQPYHLQEAEQNKVDLQFSGHTHRGQIWPFSLITDAIYEKSHGYIQKGDTHIYVSSGLGIWGGRLRIGTQSEYVVVELKGKDYKDINAGS